MRGDQSSVFDSELYSSLFTQPEMKVVWSDSHLIDCWLTFETALAAVQAELEIIPEQAAQDIATACQTLKPDWDRLSAETRLVGMPVKPLIDQIADAGSELVKKYLHWGSTTQDLLDSGLAMRLKQSLQLLRSQLVQLGELLKQMADQHRKTVMVARTNAVDASATSWGLQVSSYLAELTRHIYRMDNLYPVAITGMYGGAVGNLSSCGTGGIEVRNRLLAKRGLTCPRGMLNASQDHVTEVIQFYGLVHGTLCRIANDVETQGRASIGELREGEEGGGSSAMPHKTNPRASNMIQTLSRMGWMYAAGAPNLLDQQDVRSASMRVLNWSLVPEASLCLATSLQRAVGLISHLVVDQQQMRRNFSASHNFVLSESVSMKLAEKTGRQAAYDLVKNLLKHEDGSRDLLSAVLDCQPIREALSESEIREACQPEAWLGSNDLLIDEAIAGFDRQKQMAVN